MDRIIILGSGSSSGVPAIIGGWGKCNPHDVKNRRSRAGIYMQLGENSLLIDTSADLRSQLLQNDIKKLDAVLYTHTHADHIMGIDDLRPFTYYTDKPVNIYAVNEQIEDLHRRFGYVFVDKDAEQITHRPKLQSREIVWNETFYINNLSITPLRFCGHTVDTTGYVFAEGRVVVVPDYKNMPDETWQYLQQIDVDVLIMPLTVLYDSLYHAGMNINRGYIDKINPRRVFWTHMGPECDYEEVLQLCRDNERPAYDNLEIEL